jgi:hypothetical protein
MRTIYELDSERIYTGNSRQISDREGRKRNWIHTDTPPPEGVAQWQDKYGWKVLPEYPQPPVPTAQEIAAEIVAATQQRLDSFAQTRNYDGILSACTYATSTVEKFATEGQYCVGARDATWAKLYELLAEIEAGDRPVPSGYADIENELPVLAWPE